MYFEDIVLGQQVDLAPVYAEDLLSATVSVSKLVERNPRNGLVELTITACNQHGKVVLTNITEAIVKRKDK